MAIKYAGETALKELVAKLAAKIPTTTSDLTNDSEYVTATELTAKGYQTASDVSTAITTALSAYGDGDTEAY